MNIDKAATIDGFTRHDELSWLAETASKCNTIIEFGCHKGRSTRAMADNTNGIIYAVDPWNGNYFNDDGSINDLQTNVLTEFINNLREHIDSKKVIPLVIYSTQLPIKIIKSEIDFIFIDADHRYSEVKKDIQIAKSIIKKNGIIAGHDYDQIGWPGVKKAVDELFPKINLVGTIWWVQV